MSDFQGKLKKTATEKIQQIIDQAIAFKADAVTVEFAPEGGLEVIFVFGNTGIGDIFVDKTHESAVMGLIYENSGLDTKPRGVLQWESQGQDLVIHVEEYDSFGEMALRLVFPKET